MKIFLPEMLFIICAWNNSKRFNFLSATQYAISALENKKISTFNSKKSRVYIIVGELSIINPNKGVDQ